MSWQAPTLLDKIFATPDVGEGSTLGNFMGGYIAGSDRAAKNRADNPQPSSGADSESNGGASGDDDLGNPLPTSTSHPGGSGNWMADWFKDTLHGEVEAKNVVAYEAAQTADAARQANTVGQVIQNQGQRWMLQNGMEDQATMSKWMEDNSSLQSILDAPLPQLKTPQAQTMALNVKKGAAQTLFGQATIEQQSTLIAQAAKLVGAGFEIPVNPKTGLPDAAAVALAGRQLAARTQDNLMERADAVEQRQIAVANVKGDNQLEAVNARGEWSLKNTETRVQAMTSQASKFMDQARLKAFNEELISVRDRNHKETDPRKVDAAFARVLDKYGMTGKIAIGTDASPGGKAMTLDVAKQFLGKAGGDKEKARQMAKEQGYNW